MTTSREPRTNKGAAAVKVVMNLLRDGQWHNVDEINTAVEASGNMCPILATRLRALVQAEVLERQTVDGQKQLKINPDHQADGAKEVTGKCKHEGCYEPTDCKHGFCANHCHRHEIGSYASRSYPRTNDLHVGVEIEVNYPCPETFRRGVGIECHRDGSLGTYGAEYKLLAKSTKIIQEATELVQELWKRRARVDRKCGVHVHLDVRQLSRERINELLRWLRETQEIWFGLVPPSRRNNHFVQRIYPDGGTSHYTWANRTNYNTVEIRLHGGTLNPYKLAGWLTALIHVQAKANYASYSFPSTGDAEADFWAVFADCPAAGKEYLATRKANGGVIRDNAYGHIEE